MIMVDLDKTKPIERPNEIEAFKIRFRDVAQEIAELMNEAIRLGINTNVAWGQGPDGKRHVTLLSFTKDV